jgi:hypothetical protein
MLKTTKVLETFVVFDRSITHGVQRVIQRKVTECNSITIIVAHRLIVTELHSVTPNSLLGESPIYDDIPEVLASIPFL